MAAPADLEGFQRAYRLRSSADDGLLQQVFGKGELAELSTARPRLVETARGYFPHLTSSTYERLLREPEALQLEHERCAREMEQLAVQNYGAFIGSAKVTQAVQQGLGGIQGSLDEMAESLQPLQEGLRGFQATAAGLASRRASLRNVLQQHGALLELLELPQLLDACVRNQMYEESLELLGYCSNLLQAHEARGEEIPVLGQLQEQLAVQRANLQASLVAQLRTDIHLPACVRVMGFLRRIQRHSEEELRSLFIEHRRSFLEGHKHQVELLRGSRGSVVTALRNAADLLRTHAYDIGTQYKALFPQDDGPLGTWLGEQIAWLTGLLQAHLLPQRADGRLQTGPQPGQGGAAAKAMASASAVWGPGAAARIDATSLATILRQCHIASSTLKRLGGHFFPAVAGIFEARMEHHVCEMLDVALLTFHAELGRYDWVPSTALAGSGVAATAGAGVLDAASASGPKYLHPQALELTRHRPLAIFANDIVQVFNELRQCTLYSLRAPVVLHCLECLTGAVNLLRSVLGSQAFQASSSKATEFARLCRHFAHILVPLVASHLEAVFGPGAKLDVGAVLAAMAPDLLAPEAEEPLAATGVSDAAAELAALELAEAEAEAAEVQAAVAQEGAAAYAQEGAAADGPAVPAAAAAAAEASAEASTVSAEPPAPAAATTGEPAEAVQAGEAGYPGLSASLPPGAAGGAAAPAEAGAPTAEAEPRSPNEH